jgi:DNA (cytosine-5)-methyltransferase 1
VISPALTMGGLFSGMGGFELAATRLGIDVKWMCEIDPFCRRVLAKHWPNVPVHPDVRELTGDDVEPVDILTGGFPCQDVSCAGQRRGIEGARSGLWSQFHRLIRTLRPRFAVVENVPGLLDGGIGRVLGDLAEIGFDAEWECISAASLGAPQLRDRVWLVAYPAGIERSVLREVDGKPDGSTPEVGGWVKAERCEDRRLFAMAPRHCLARMWTPQSGVQRVLDGVPNRMERLTAIGNAVTPQNAEFILRQVLAVERRASA